MALTKDQIIVRIKEINKERSRLGDELRSYEKYFSDMRSKEELEKHINFVGKCYVSKNNPDNKNKYIKAFKILQIHEAPNQNYAICLALIDGRRYTCFCEYGIQIMTIPVWSFNESRMMSKETDLKVIDFYEEITQSSFDTLYEEHQNKISTTISV